MMILSRCIASLLLALAAMAGDARGTAPVAPTGFCVLKPMAEVSARFVQGHVLVPANIDAAPVQMLVDTGATTSMLTPESVVRLRLPIDTSRASAIHGTGGTVITRNVLVRSLRVGNQDWLAGSIATGSLARQYQEDPPLVGVLGADFLDRFDIELDVPQQRMVLWRVEHCQGDFIPWQGRHFPVRLTRYPPNRMVAQAHIDGHPVAALIDWGATSSTISTAAAAAVGVSPTMLLHDQLLATRGVDQKLLSARRHLFGLVAVGPVLYRNVVVEVVDLHIPDVGMLLGADFVRTRHVWLSYATNQMFVGQP
jgi:predicted aspartyl protease